MVVVKTIYLNFEDTELETLYIHQGEKGRGYLLIPPVDVSGLSCQVELVKPDNTFVINDLSYDESGNVLFEVPEQAGAVIGVGWYNISFYDDDVVIYTCYGRYQIDDHLITNGMLESIAEVNGYQFPHDFVTQGDIEHIADEVKDVIINDNVYSDSSTWSSEKIANHINDDVLVPLDRTIRRLDSVTTYSTTEHVVGKWIDGSDLYEGWVTITGAEINGGNTDYKYKGDFMLKSYITDADRIMPDLQHSYYIVSGVQKSFMGFRININTGELIVMTLFAESNAELHILCQYTKSTTSNRTLLSTPTTTLKADLSGEKQKTEV